MFPCHIMDGKVLLVKQKRFDSMGWGLQEHLHLFCRFMKRETVPTTAVLYKSLWERDKCLWKRLWEKKRKRKKEDWFHQGLMMVMTEEQSVKKTIKTWIRSWPFNDKRRWKAKHERAQTSDYQMFVVVDSAGNFFYWTPSKNSCQSYSKLIIPNILSEILKLNKSSFNMIVLSPEVLDKPWATQ